MSIARLYSTLEIKSADSDQWTLQGIASTPTTDRTGDIVEPKGATFRLPLALLWQHDSTKPVGSVTAASVDDGGISIKASIMRPTDDMPASLADRLKEAWASVKSGLVRGLSIGFVPGEFDILKGGGLHHTKFNLLELSLVTIPANADASIFGVKAAAAGQPVYPSARVMSGAYVLRSTK